MRAAMVGVMMALLAGMASAADYAAGPWTVKASLISRGSGARIDGSVRGPRCELLSLDIFTKSKSGWTGHAATTVENVSGSRKFFKAGTAYGGGRGAKIIAVYARCISR